MTSYQVPRVVQGEAPERLRQWRVGHDLTQGELAARLGCSQATVSEIESGKFYPSEDVIRACAKRCRIKRAAWGERPKRRHPRSGAAVMGVTEHVSDLTSVAAPRKGARSCSAKAATVRE